MLNHYRDLGPGEKVLFWFLILSFFYIIWQVAIRPFWNHS